MPIWTNLQFAQMLLWKYGPVSDTEDGKITAWRHLTFLEPDAQQIALDMTEYLAYLDGVKYLALRKSEYPPIEDQLDAIWKGGADEAAMRSQIAAIKNKYPKGKTQ